MCSYFALLIRFPEIFPILPEELAGIGSARISWFVTDIKVRVSSIHALNMLATNVFDLLKSRLVLRDRVSSSVVAIPFRSADVVPDQVSRTRSDAFVHLRNAVYDSVKDGE